MKTIYQNLETNLGVRAGRFPASFEGIIVVTKTTNRMKVQIWREGLSAKFEGTVLGATIEAFRFLNVDQQKRALEKMQESHTRLLAAQVPEEIG